MWRARVLGAVDAMPEPHHGLLVRALPLHIIGGHSGIADLLRHPDHVLRRAAVGRPGQSGDRRRDRSVQVRLGPGDDARRERRGVRAVLGVQDHVGIHQPRRVRAGALAEKHVEEVGGVPERIIGRDGRAAVADLLVRGDDHRHLGGQPHGLAQRGGGGVVADLRVERGQR
jgi:hypothetical protein